MKIKHSFLATGYNPTKMDSRDKSKYSIYLKVGT